MEPVFDVLYYLPIQSSIKRFVLGFGPQITGYLTTHDLFVGMIQGQKNMKTSTIKL